MSRAADAGNEMTKVNDQEKSGSMKHYDEAASTDKVNKLWAEVAAKKAAEEKKAAELAAIEVSDDDVTLVAESLNISEQQAKLCLQKKKGDVVAALREAIGLPKVKTA